MNEGKGEIKFPPNIEERRAWGQGQDLKACLQIEFEMTKFQQIGRKEI